MDLFSRYVFRQSVNALLIILISLTAVVWLATALRQLSLLTAQGQTFWLFLKMTLLALPSLMVMIAPIAFFIACIHTLDRLNNDSELIVYNAAGATIWRVAKPFLVLAVLVALFVSLINLYIGPSSLRLLRTYVIKVRTDLISQVLQPGQFSSPEQKMTFHIRDKDQNGDLLGLIVHDERDPNQLMSYLAERGRIQKQGGQAYLIMSKGHIQRRIKDKEKSEGKTKAEDKEKGKDKEEFDIQIIAFEQYLFDLSRFGPKKDGINYKPRERYLNELLYPDPNDAYFKSQSGKFRSELHERFAGTIYPIVFALIVVAALGNARTTRQSRIHNIFIAVGLCTGIRMAGLAATNLLTLKAWAVLLVYGIPCAVLLIAAYSAHARMTP